MFSYTKVLPLVLLLSIPAIAMDKNGALSQDEALTSTILVRQQFAEAITQETALDEQIAVLVAQKNTAAATKSVRAQELEKKYGKKVEEIVSLNNLLGETKAECIKAEQAKIRTLEELEQAHKKSREGLESQIHALAKTFDSEKQAKEQSHNTVIEALVARKLQRETELKKAEQIRDELYVDLTKVRNGQTSSKPGLLGLGFLGL